MSRAGEKLYGDWERRLKEEAGPVPWRRWLANAALLVLALVLLGSALFGFG